MHIVETNVWQDFMNGTLEGKEVQHTQKLWKDAQSFYAFADLTLEKELVMYEVYTYNQGDQDQKGNLNWGLTVLKPLCINKECNMTRGHYHEDLNCAEFYFCIKGDGLLLLMKEDGTCWAETMRKGSVHHIDGKVAHRLINTGSEDLAVGACWPSTAGHDYERIEKQPFTYRVFKDPNITIKNTKECL